MPSLEGRVFRTRERAPGGQILLRPSEARPLKEEVRRLLRFAAGLVFTFSGCADYTNFTCSGCTQMLYYRQPGEVTCLNCNRLALVSQCPHCRMISVEPDYGLIRCGGCRREFWAFKCRSCRTAIFAPERGAPCPVCGPEASGVSGEIRPEEARARKKRGDDHASKGDWTQAIVDYGESLRLDPRDSAAHYGLACALCRSGRTENALLELERAVAAGFSNWDLLRKDADLEPLRKEPRYRTLLENTPR
jgi:tetratricopeptide (TPR) repeat protein